MNPKAVKQFQKEILDWYSLHQRDLPWRKIPFDSKLKQRDPYKILVSEVMLQQTQVGRVIPKYEAWLMRFPTVQDLASTETSEVLRMWSGLGYNRRAINLQKTAYMITHEHNGIFPRYEKELLNLPGIGKYTARALLCFAFNQQIAVVDTNVRKVILTRFCHPERSEGSHKIDSSALLQNDNKKIASVTSGDLAMTESEIWEIAEQLLPKGRAYEWNQALMDYATVMLKKEKIAIPKQTTFKGSNRYYRGQTVKILLQYQGVSIKELAEMMERESEFMLKIIEGLVADGLIVEKKGKIFLP